MEVQLTVAGLVLAAGRGRRIGGPKALLRHEGSLLVERAVAAVREAGCAPVVVVIGAAAEQVAADADLAGTVVVVNKAWSSGVGSSLRAGLNTLAEQGATAALVVPVDMPGITAEAVRRVAREPAPGALACATFDGRRTHPMLVGSEHWSGIATLANGDVGMRPYLLLRAAQVAEVPCDDVAAAGDVDTPDDAATWGITPPK